MSLRAPCLCVNSREEGLKTHSHGERGDAENLLSSSSGVLRCDARHEVSLT